MACFMYLCPRKSTPISVITYRIEAHVTDAAIVKSRWPRRNHYLFHRGRLMETDRYVYAPGQQADVTVRTLDYDSKPYHHCKAKFEAHRSWDQTACESFRRPMFHR